MEDIPNDFKIEHDRLIYEMEPIAKRLYEIGQSLPRATDEETIEYNGFMVVIRGGSLPVDSVNQ